MPSLADLLAVEAEWEFEGAVYKLRPSDQVEQGQFSRLLERRAREGAARATEEEGQDRLFRVVSQDTASFQYEWGSDAYCAALSTPAGFAAMLDLILKGANPDKVIRPGLAERMTARRLVDLAVVIQAEAEPDPEKKTALLRSVGLPADWLDSRPTASSSSSTPRTAAPGTSPPSAG